MEKGKIPVILVDITFFPAEMIDTDIHGSLANERRQALRFSQTAGTQFLEGDDKRVLAQIVGQLNAAGAF
jgi:hypothetical protein